MDWPCLDPLKLVQAIHQCGEEHFFKEVFVPADAAGTWEALARCEWAKELPAVKDVANL